MVDIMDLDEKDLDEELVEFDENDKELFLKGLGEDIQKCKKLDNTQLYNFVLLTIRQINEKKAEIDQLYIQYTALLNILSLRLVGEPFNEYGCIGCAYAVEEADDLKCTNSDADKDLWGVPKEVSSEPNSCPFYVIGG